MTKKFYTDKDIEELAHSGVRSLRTDDDTVLTDLAFEKARKLGMLVDDTPPAAPVRPYLSDGRPRRSTIESGSVASSLSQPALTPDPSPFKEREAQLEKRIREKIAVKLGNQVDATLLDTIIKRTLKIVRLK